MESEIIVINTADDLDSVPRHSKFKFFCKNCNAEVIMTYDAKPKLDRYKTLLCRNCYNKQQWIDKFGVDNPAKLEESYNKARETKILRYGDPNYINKEKIRSTMMERYGGYTTWESPVLKEKIQQQFLEKYGSVSPFGNKEVQSKRDETMLERHGVKYGMQYDEGKSKFESSMLKSHGVKYSFQSKELMDKSRSTNLELNGSETYNNRSKAKETMTELFGGGTTLESDELRIRKENTCLEKYGKINPYQYGSDEFKELMLFKFGTEHVGPSKFIFDGYRFDSMWELYFYIYCRDSGFIVIKEPFYFEYEYNGIVHKYYPDFIVNDQLIEIKGSQFFENGKMINPYNRSLDGLFEAKHQCGILHNVRFILLEDMMKYINYAKISYGITKDNFSKFESYTPFNVDYSKEYQDPIGLGKTPFDI